MNWKKRIKTCTILVALVTFVIHMINKLIYFMYTIDDLLGKRKGLYYKWRFGNIFYKKEGTGKPILLIHDLTACSSEYEWDHIVKDLSKSNTVYTLDLLGCGKSDKPNFTYSNFLYVQLITDFVKNIIGSKADIIATGSSSSFVLMACQNDPSIINKIMLINPPSISCIAKLPSKRSELLKFLIALPFIGTFLYNILHSEQRMEQIFLTEYFYSPQLVTDNLVKLYCEAGQVLKSNSKYLFASIKGRYTNVNVMECLKHLDNNIYILVGTGNPTYREIAEEYQYYAPAIEIQGIEKAKHLPQLEVPEQTVEQIKLLFELDS